MTSSTSRSPKRSQNKQWQIWEPRDYSFYNKKRNNKRNNWKTLTIEWDHREITTHMSKISKLSTCSSCRDKRQPWLLATSKASSTMTRLGWCLYRRRNLIMRIFLVAHQNRGQEFSRLSSDISMERRQCLKRETPSTELRWKNTFPNKSKEAL